MVIILFNLNNVLSSVSCPFGVCFAQNFTLWKLYSIPIGGMYLFFFSILLSTLVTFQFQPTKQLSTSRNSYQPGRVKDNICSLQDA